MTGRSITEGSLGGRSAPIVFPDARYPSVDVITDQGRACGVEHLLQVSSLTRYEAELVIVMVARDWSHGHESLAMTGLGHHTDLVGAYRVVAAMVAPTPAPAMAQTQPVEEVGG